MMVEVPPDNVATFSASSSYALHEQAGPHLWFLILNLKEGPALELKGCLVYG